MKYDLVLHIGANKTGSSAIQAFMRTNTELLSTAGYMIPDRELGRSRQITGEHVFALQKFITTNNRAGLSDTVRDLIASTDGRTVLLSAENLSNPGRHQFFEDLAKEYAIKVIVYIRRQDDLIASSWQQWHSKVMDDFNAWLVTALQTIGHWERLIKSWEGIVGIGHVTVRVFEREEFHGGNIMQDFLDCLDVGLNAGSPVFPTADINPSFNDIITDLVAGNDFLFRDANDNEFYQMIARLTGDRYTKGPKVSLLSGKQREKIIAFFAPQNERVRSEYAPHRERLFKPLNHSKYRYVTADDLAREQRQLLITLIYALWKERQS